MSDENPASAEWREEYTRADGEVLSTDDRIAVDWEGQCRSRYGAGPDEECNGLGVGQPDALAAERYTARSIERDREVLKWNLYKARLQTVRSNLGGAENWYSIISQAGPGGAAYPTRVFGYRGPSHPDRTYTPPAGVSDGAITSTALERAVAGGPGAPGISQIASTTNSMVAETVDADAFAALQSPAQRAAFLNPVYQMARDALPDASALNEYIDQKLLVALRNYNVGGAANTQLPGVIQQVKTFFTNESNLDFAAQAEGELVRHMRADFSYLYHASIQASGYDIYTTNAIVESGIDLSSANAFSRQSSYASVDDFVGAFAELIVRARAHQIILNFEAVLQEEQERAAAAGEEVPDFLTPEGLYTDEAQERQTRLSQLARIRFGDRDEECETAINRRLAEQCFLIDSVRNLATQYQAKKVNFQNFIPLQGNTDTIVNKLVYNPQLECMDLLTPAEISSLVPKIRIYKILYDEQRTAYEQQVPFENYVTEGEISDMMSSGIERGQGAGIVSFDWKLDGQNPFAARRFINAQMKLFFQSMKEFVEPLSAQPAVGPPREPGGTPRRLTVGGGNPPLHYVDLVNTGRSERTPTLDWNPDYYKLRVEVGWTLPSTALDVFTGDIECKKKAIKESVMNMYVTATEHEIDVNDEGNIYLTIEYVAWQEASYSDGDADILATEEIRQIRRDYREAITAARQSGTDECATGEGSLIATLEEIRKHYIQNARQSNYLSWRRLLDALTNPADPKVYYVDIPTGRLEEYYDAICRGESTSGIIDRLLTAAFPQQSDVVMNVDQDPDAAARAAEAAIRNNRGDGEGSPLETIENIAWRSEDESTKVQFFFFGDLMEAALGLPFGDNDADGRKLEKNLRVLLGPLTLTYATGATEDEETPTERLLTNLNLADVPISVNFFIEWFLQDVVGQNRRIYPAMQFIQSVLTTLIQPILTRQCKELKNIPRQYLQLRTSFLSAGGRPGSTVDPLTLLKNQLDRTRLNVDGAFIDATRGSRSILRPPSEGSPVYHYMLIYALNTASLEDLAGDPRADRARGIYHFGIGRNSGLLKNIKFSKTDFSLREARLERELLSHATGLAVLANVYSVKIKTFGNTLFVPGSRIYIDPTGVISLGSASATGAVSRMLGIGGYHIVYNVQSYIESGKYETVVDALWETAGGEDEPVVDITDASRLAACARRIESLTGEVRYINGEMTDEEAD